MEGEAGSDELEIAIAIQICSDANPTQIAEYSEGHALTYTDLGTDQNPTKVDLDKKYDVTFEISL